MRATAASEHNEPMLDLLITHASLPDGRTHMSVAVQDGRIVEVAEGLHSYYNQHRFLDEDTELQSARLALIAATRSCQRRAAQTATVDMSSGLSLTSIQRGIRSRSTCMLAKLATTN